MSDIVTKLDNTEEPLLRLEDLSIDYRIRNGYLSAVSDVNFTMNRGEIVALVGESGCGKSTIAFTIMRLLMDGNEKIGGKILFKGEDLNKIPVRDMEKMRGKHIGMIFQNPLDSLNPVYRTGSQVEEAILLDGLSHKEAWERVINLYKDVRIPDAEKRVNSYPHELSGGMRQRVMIAMMLSRTPELLIADEPTTALDVTIEAQILQILKDLKTQYNTAILMITHNFGLVAEVADRIAVMYAGDIIEIGLCNEIFYNPQHPYTWALLSSLPQLGIKGEPLYSIHGTPPNLFKEIKGDAFAPRNPRALNIDYVIRPPYFEVSPTHYAKTWLLDPRSPKIEPPAIIQRLRDRWKEANPNV